jgi:hypothetical protein
MEMSNVYGLGTIKSDSCVVSNVCCDEPEASVSLN